MSLSFGVVMDPIGSITPYKDTTLAMLLAASARGWELYEIHTSDLALIGGEVRTRRRRVRVFDDPKRWYEIVDEDEVPLNAHDIVLMRKDPPIDMRFMHATYLLELAASQDLLVSNRPSSLRDINEKLAIAHFLHLAPTTIVTADAKRIRSFLDEHGDIIIKPLDGMGGAGIFRLRPDDPNFNIILEQSTARGREHLMVQKFIPEISQGDKRVIVINGQAAPFALARIPLAGETRGNLAAGGRGVAVPLGDAEHNIVAEVGPWLVERGIVFAGLDVIGDKLTEINVTSPTGVRELDAHMQAQPGGHRPDANGYCKGLADLYLDALEQQLGSVDRF